MLLMIDNYDSFTYNLVQYFGELGVEVKVLRNDEVNVTQALAYHPQHIVISPGPCTPNEAGISLPLIQTAMVQSIPLLGVCLGHQSIGQACGGQVIRAHTVMHGKTSLIHHAGAGIFAELTQPFTATRYHSLVIDRLQLPTELEMTAWTCTDNGEIDEIMGIQHRDLPIHGVQFHPESILSEHGHALLRHFLAVTV
ncbi:aminodeoxychorismate/anthranilate synthase component II [Rhodoferax sp. 4810]|uniref:Aminodeoxychorismate/anthranilate synthase component II n=1 Tax=Thiospirillum jenense TaxID=1653858 RepID=A0A839HK01_9GAMM|nr:aminodeoxychorismate/anthranilate synthase component II [Thiospirillum jenense]MBB1075470.1 aminodeoxychorismate/anthranilate synthase component II [Rhodoferax jenense]MBB1126849.1 aminodeoxychorismate/anthranilate synthase component II [Thiospirillum jenense]